MTIEISVLPWPAAIVDGAGKLRASNALWTARFGNAQELELCWPRAASELRHVSTEASGEGQRSCVPVPGENASVRLQVAPLNNDGAPAWLLMATENDASDERVDERTQQLLLHEAERGMDGVALRMQGRHWRAFFHEAAAGKSFIGLHGETLEVNRALCELLDRSEGELLNLFVRDLRHPHDRERVEDHYRAILNGEPPVAGVEARYLHKDGRYLDCLISLSLIRDSRDKPLYFAAEIDNITSWRQAQASLHKRTQQLEEANLELMRSNTDLERFAVVASHDLQEPLRKIRVFGDRLTMLATDFTPDTELVRYVEVMTRSAQRMQNLIEDLLAFGRLRNRDAPFTPVDLGALWVELREEFEARLQESGARLHVGALPVVRGNPVRLRQLFGNLLSNALKFRGDDPPLVEVRARAATGQGDAAAMVCIEVKDNGIGFDPSHAEAIFDIFVRLHGRGHYPGTGIGLSICRRVAREHGGDVKAFSLPNQGARFVVTLMP